MKLWTDTVSIFIIGLPFTYFITKTFVQGTMGTGSVEAPDAYGNQQHLSLITRDPDLVRRKPLARG